MQVFVFWHGELRFLPFNNSEETETYPANGYEQHLKNINWTGS